MIYGSVCSGIEAASVAWEPLGWEAAWFSEIERFPSAVLNYRFPKVKNLGDMTKLKKRREFNGRRIDVLVGGTPCQSFSIAGLRAGMADPRGNLALAFLGLVDAARPRWVVWENVPGVLSADESGAFGSFIGGLAELGYGLAWRILDAQYFGVPQQRRRVFVIGYLGDWRPAAAVLFERESLSGNPPSSEKERETAPRTTIPSLTASGRGTARAGESRGQDPLVVQPKEIAKTLEAKSGVGEGFDASEDGTGRGTPLVPIAFSSKDHGGDAGKISPTIRAGTEDKSHANAGVPPAVVYENHGQDSRVKEVGTSPQINAKAGTGGGNLPIVAETPKQVQWASGGGKLENDTAQALRSGAEHSYQFMRHGMTVRRLTPRECERLQGFPDDWTLITWRGKPADQCPDGPRYKAIGNSMAVPVMRWIGQRIQMVEVVLKQSSKKKPIWPK